MSSTSTNARVALRNVLYLTDFSEPSAAAFPFATSIARKYGAKLHALNVVIPAPYVYTTPELTIAAIDAQEEDALADMQAIDAQLTGITHDTAVVRGLWSGLRSGRLSRTPPWTWSSSARMAAPARKSYCWARRRKKSSGDRRLRFSPLARMSKSAFTLEGIFVGCSWLPTAPGDGGGTAVRSIVC